MGPCTLSWMHPWSPARLPPSTSPTNLWAMSTVENSTDAGKRKSIWDNDLPAGDSPPLPRWPLTVCIVLYGLWMVFLIAMWIVRLKYAG